MSSFRMKMPRSVCSEGVLMVCIFALILSLSPVVLSDDHLHGLSEKKSFAIINHPAMHHHRESRESHGEKVRYSRQAAQPNPGVMTYTAGETKSLLDAHMQYRMNVTPSAADMNVIGWNTELANLARGWAERCNFAHGFPTDPQSYGGIVAQNIWQGTYTFGLTASVKDWYDEYKDYEYDTATCAAQRECGHYRTLVFGDLKEIGCGSATCGSNTLTVCNYGPSVPPKGVPYKAGPPCALCSSGTGWCDKKLCRSDCSGAGAGCECKLQCQNCGKLDSDSCTCDCKAGWGGTDCSEKCVDGKDYCAHYNPTACENDMTVKKDCPDTCELCDALDKNTPSADKCCDGKLCSDGEVLEESTCTCVNYLAKTGAAAALVAVSWVCFATVILSVVTINYSR